MGFSVFTKRSDTTRKHFTLYDPDTGDEVPCWVDLRTELSGAELANLSLFSAFDRASFDGEMHVDFAALQINRLDAWVVGWSFGTGTTRPKDRDAVLELRGPALAAVDGIVLAHAEEANARAALMTDPKLVKRATSKAGSRTRAPKGSIATLSEPSDSGD